MLYFVEAVGLDAVKIGTAATDAGVAHRLESIGVGCPVAVILLGVAGGERAEERELHARFREHRLRGEWYRLSAIREAIGPMLAAARPPACSACGGAVHWKTIERARNGGYDPMCIPCAGASRRIHEVQKATDCRYCGASLLRKSASQRRYVGRKCGACGRWQNEEARQRLSSAMRVAWERPEYKERREAARLATLAARVRT